jgi:hypothetical protein
MNLENVHIVKNLCIYHYFIKIVIINYFLIHEYIIMVIQLVI